MRKSRKDTPCCEANSYGFKCLCSVFSSSQEEDDGYGDWLHDQEKDRKMMEEVEREHSLEPHSDQGSSTKEK